MRFSKVLVEWSKGHAKQQQQQQQQQQIPVCEICGFKFPDCLEWKKPRSDHRVEKHAILSGSGTGEKESRLYSKCHTSI